VSAQARRRQAAALRDALEDARRAQGEHAQALAAWRVGWHGGKLLAMRLAWGERYAGTARQPASRSAATR
jgi:hypothetical protein